MGRVVHRDKARDLALVQLDRLGPQARPLELAETGVRDRVLHIGSGTGELFPMTVRRLVRVDAPAVPVLATGTPEPVKAPSITLTGTTDDSGGPLVDREGRLVGLVVGAGTGPAGRAVTLAIGTAEVRAFLADKDKETPAPPVDPIVREFRPPANPIPDDFGPPVDPIPGDVDVEALYKRVVKSCVFIVTPAKGGYGMGSGSLIDSDKRYVLTTHHSVGDEDTVFVQFPVFQKDGSIMTDRQEYIKRIPAGQAIKGKVLYRDKNRDLAVVQLERVPAGTKALPLATKSIGVGATVWNIGNPGAVRQVFGITEGRVRAVGVEKFLVGSDNEVFEIRARMVTTTNPTNPGDSGGPLFDRRGYQVGLTMSGKAGGPARNVSHYIDVTEIWAFLREKKVIIKDLADEKDEPKGDPKSEDTPPAKRDRGPDLRPPLDPDRGLPVPDRPRDVKGPSAEDERAAGAELRRAKLFAGDPDNRDYYRARLREVIKKYPGTAAAKEAQKALDGEK